MRKFCILLALTAVTSIVCLSTAKAEEPKQTKSSQAAKDPNYRYYNGQWLYWMPKQQNWKVWNGSEWTDYQPTQSYRTRAYSYDNENAGPTEGNEAVWRLFGRPLTTVPDSVGSNSQIIGSYGFRRAGSKMVGNY